MLCCVGLRLQFGDWIELLAGGFGGGMDSAFKDLRPCRIHEFF